MTTAVTPSEKKSLFAAFSSLFTYYFYNPILISALSIKEFFENEKDTHLSYLLNIHGNVHIM
jgi:hypothetical protein